MENRKTGFHGWIATTGIIITSVAAIIGIKAGPSRDKKAPANIRPAPTASPIPHDGPKPNLIPAASNASAVNSTDQAQKNDNDAKSISTTIAVEPYHAALTLNGGSAPSVLVLTTLRFRNNGTRPVVIAWQDGRNGTALDLGDGTHLTVHSGSAFIGVSDCGNGDPTRCLGQRGTTIAPAESANAQIRFSRFLNGHTIDIAKAAKADLIGTLFISTQQPNQTETKNISLSLDVTSQTP